MIDRLCWNHSLMIWINHLTLCLVILTSMSACQVASLPQTVEATPSALSDTLIQPEKIITSGVPVESTPIVSRFVPPVWNFISTDFDDGAFDGWGQVSESNLSLMPGGGIGGSTGLSVAVHKRETYLYKTDVVKTTEGYFTFWFNPNKVNIPDESDLPIPGKSIRIADIKGYQHYDVVAALRIWKPRDSGDSYKAYLEWQAEDGSHFDFDMGQFELANAF
jgi:hypothetical protein